MASTRTSASASTFDERVLSGQVLEVVGTLLGDVAQRAEVLGIIAKLVARNEELERLLTGLRDAENHHERISRAQLALFVAEAAKVAAESELRSADAALSQQAQPTIDEKTAAEAAKKAETPVRQPRGPRELPANLATVANPIAVAPETRACPQCKAERTSMGHDCTPVIELKPAEVFVRMDLRERLVCKACDGGQSRAEVGDKVVDGGLYGSTLVASLVVDKYEDGLALHRGRARLLRLGLDMAVSTMADQVRWASELLEPLWRYSCDRVLAADVMHLDATRLPTLVKSLGRAYNGTLWGMVGRTGSERIAAFMYASTGKARGQRRDDEGELIEWGPLDILEKRKGPVVVDAAGLFDAAFKRPTLYEIGCNMHARRYFVKALESGDTRAAHAIRAFKALYIIEESVRGKPPDAVLEARQTRSSSIYSALLAWATAYKGREPPSSRLGRALAYLTNHARALERFLSDGRLPIDNGEVERLHRRPALLRMNSLFAGSHEGGERAAVVLSLLGSCRFAGVDPTAYLGDVLPRLHRRGTHDLDALMPAAWLAAHPTSAVPAAPDSTVIA